MTTILAPLDDFAWGPLSGTYSSASTSLVVQSGYEGNFPDPSANNGLSYQCVIFDGSYANAVAASLDGNAEIVTVTAKSGQTFTVTRGSGGTLPAEIGEGWYMYRGLTAADWSTVDTQLSTLGSRVDAIEPLLSALNFDAGGNLIFNGAWDGSHIVMNGNHLWVDATGDLRIKSSAPTSDTDGSVVGGQT